MLRRDRRIFDVGWDGHTNTNEYMKMIINMLLMTSMIAPFAYVGYVVFKDVYPIMVESPHTSVEMTGYMIFTLVICGAMCLCYIMGKDNA